MPTGLPEAESPLPPLGCGLDALVRCPGPSPRNGCIVATSGSATIFTIDALGRQSSAANVTTPSGSTPPDTTAPSTPAGLTGTPVAAGRIDLAWTAATDNVAVAGYNVYRDGAKVNTAPVGSISYSDTGLVGGANHTYTVKAVDAAANESAASGPWSGAASSGAVTTSYAYDPENRLTGLQSGSSVIATYAYDGAGNRYAKTAAGVTTAYTLDLASSLPQVLTETAGSTVTSYAYGAGPLEIDKAGTTYWYLSDTLGSVRLVTDSTGAAPATYAYAAFGSTRKSSGTLANEVRFTGQRTDGESGLEFLRARTYDPSTGTFLQRDTWAITPTSSQSLDAYCYTANNPINAVDPSGHMYDGGRGVSSTIGVCGYDQYATGCAGGGGTTITQAGPGAYTPPVTGKTQGPPPTTPKSDSTPKGCSLLPWDSGNCEGQAAGGVGNLWAQGPGGFINDNAKQIAVVAIIAGSLFVCNVGSAACAALILGALEAGGTVCAEDDEACLQAAERVVIGKMPDIIGPGALNPGERTLLPQLPNLGNDADNWTQNV